jgi:hypothetical protein
MSISNLKYLKNICFSKILVGIVLGYRSDGQGIRFQLLTEVRDVPLLHNHEMGSGATYPSAQWVLGVKWPGHEADCLPSSSAKVKDAWSYTSMMWCLVKHVGRFTFSVNSHSYYFIPYGELIMHNAVSAPTSVSGLITCAAVNYLGDS